jgi:hypothetical protein
MMKDTNGPKTATVAEHLAERLRFHATMLRRKPTPLADLIPLLTTASDELCALSREVPEGCTPADARLLRAANHAFAQDVWETQTILRDLYSQVKKFCEEQGEADFETGPATALLRRIDGKPVDAGLRSQLAERLARYSRP